jgi:hypothetical protein
MKIILTSTSLYTTNVKFTKASPEFMQFEYHTLANNKPNTYGNFVQIWQDDSVEWNNPSGGSSQTVPTNGIQGDLTVPLQVQKKNYICAFSVGPSVQNICATAFLPEANINGQVLFSPKISVLPAQDSLLVNYHVPAGCLPGDYGHWVGLFNGGDNPYETPPLTLTTVSGNAGAGSVPLYYGMSAGRSYLAVYFAGGAGADQTSPACALLFTAAQ